MPIFSIRLLALVLGIAWFGLTHAAEIGISQHDDIDDVIFSGEIKIGDMAALKPFINKVAGSGRLHRFIIHAPGGNVAEAMKIGDLLRENKFSVFQPHGVSCISACVFAIMGGTKRVINGRIGLHHPLFPNISNNPAQVQNLLLEGKQAMIQYTVRMKVNAQIVQDMYSLPNESDIKYLDQDQIKAYRLSTNN